MRLLRLMPLLLLGLLTGCGSSESKSFMIHGPEHSLTLIRTKSFIWDDRWDLALVVANNPDCQRRHPLKDASEVKFKVELYQAAEGGWILRQGNRWYVTELEKCQLQQFKEPPPEPGTLIGAFVEKADGFRFVLDKQIVSGKAMEASEEKSAK